MSRIDDALGKAVRKDLRRHQHNLSEAVERGDGPAQRRAEKGLALWTSKLLCPHKFIEHKRMRVMGHEKHSYKCIDCKAYALSLEPL